VVLSDTSTMSLYESGISTVMSENICFPAKLTNGHVLNLIHKRVDRIFLPFVVYEHDEKDDTANTYNCPIVTGYSEVLKSAMDPASQYGIPIDAPAFSFKDPILMQKACRQYIDGIIGKGQIRKKAFEEIFESAVTAQRTYEQQLIKRCNEIADESLREKRLLIVLAGRPYHADPLIQHKIAEYIADSGVDVITEDLMRYRPSSGKEVQLVMQWAYTNRIIKAAEWVAQQGDHVHYVELTSFGCGPDAFMLDEIDELLRRSGKNACMLKIDDITNTGSMKLRLRSLIESLKLLAADHVPQKIPAVHTPPYTHEDRKRTILMPWFGDFYSPFLPAMFKLLGYDAVNLPPPNQESAEMGLRYSNNEVCYPATLVVGDFMKALLSGKYRHEDIAMAITQTGGQCRATNYLSLLKKTMVSAGFEDIPVISIGIGTGTFNAQPGFELKWSKIYRELIYTIVFADCLSQLYHATLPRSTEKQKVAQLRDTYFALGAEVIASRKPRQFLDLASQAVGDFMALISREDVPRIGVVGEIFVKYNSFGNRRVVDWLLEHDIEPVIPPITSFFLEALASSEARVSGLVERRQRPKFLKDLLERYIFGIIRNMESRMKGFPWYRPIGNPHEEAAHASEIINLNAQFGEGWLIPAEFARFARDGVNNVVSFQPFGCIANHIISKGIEKKTRELYPQLNLLFLDFDSGMSDVNIFNRLHFMAQHATESELQQ
jgi:predicted nucleotide-binding protein (sugar kinase/HSP70/actin superfamily)